MMCREGTDCKVRFVKDDEEDLPAKFKMAVVIDVVRDEKTLTQVAAEHSVSLSLAAEWRDELLDGADDVFS